MERSLNVNDYDFSENKDTTNNDDIKTEQKLDVKKLLKSELFNTPIDRREFENLSSECAKMRIELAQLKEEKKQWNNTKNDLNRLRKRNDNLNKMLDQMNDDKYQLNLVIEDLQVLLSKNNIPYDNIR